MTLLNFVTGQSNAAAQGTAIALGTYHTVGLLCQPEQAAPEYAMYAMGRGFHGQLGLEQFDNQEQPQRVCAGSHCCSCPSGARLLLPSWNACCPRSSCYLPGPSFHAATHPAHPPSDAPPAAGGRCGAGRQGSTVPGRARRHTPRRRQRRQQPLRLHLAQVGWGRRLRQSFRAATEPWAYSYVRACLAYQLQSHLCR